MHIFRPRANVASVLLALLPLTGAVLIAISRLEDYRHDVFDVIAGSTLGMAFAYWSYRRYFSSLSAACCHRPYPSRYETFLEDHLAQDDDVEGGLQASPHRSRNSREDVAETHPLNANT